MFQNRIFNVLEKANNNIKLTIVEHLVFSQIQRIQNSQREKNFEKRTDKGRKRYEKLHPTETKTNPFHWRRPKTTREKSRRSALKTTTVRALPKKYTKRERERNKQQQTNKQKGIEKRERQVSIIYINMCL